MKMPLTLSVVLNGLLLVALGVSFAHHENPASVPATPASPSEPNPATAVQAAPPFRWSQLEATNDYRSYVANLRAVGCPEPTIRAIVTADFPAASSFERRRLEVAGKSVSPISSEAMKQAIASVLGSDAIPARAETIKPGSPAIVASRSQSQSENVQPAGQTISHAGYPVVFQNAVLNDSTLTENQKAAVRQLQQQFTDAVSTGNQNPADPAYRARWQTAQQEADDALRAQLGTQAYLAYQQQHYYSNFQQVMLSAGEGPVTINPEELAK